MPRQSAFPDPIDGLALMPRLLSCGEKPVLEKDFLEGVDDGTLDAKMDIGGRVTIAEIGNHVALADVHPTRETDVAIDAYHFAVIPKV